MNLRDKRPTATKEVAISSLRLPSGWKQVLASDQAARVGKSLEHAPILQRPAIRKADRSVIFGLHRIAAASRDGQTTVVVDVWDVDEAEAAEMRDIENGIRRPPDVDAQQRLLDKWTADIKGTRDDANSATPVAKLPTAARPGRPKTPRGEARENLAAARGVSPGAQARADQRKAKAEEAETLPQLPESWLYRLGAFETWGVEISEDFAQVVVQARQAVDAVGAKLNAVLSSITAQQKEAEATVSVMLDFNGLYSRLQQDAGALRSARPEALCCYCKAVPLLMRNCKGCNGLGTVGRDALANAPAELKVGGDEAGVYLKPNEFRRLSELAA